MNALKKFLIIQTSFTGDVILATSVLEKLHAYFPGAAIDFLLRKGNESLFDNHPFIHETIAWDKKQHKFSNLFRIISRVRKNRYDVVINLHRFVSSGLTTALSGAKDKRGFDKNPFSFFFTSTYKHKIGNGQHEIERNHELIRDLTDAVAAQPKLYPSEKDVEAVKKIRKEGLDYICIAPASIWFTKQFPKEKWIGLINALPDDQFIYLLGSKSDFDLCESIKSGIKGAKSANVINLAGHLSFLESAALMKNATMNYVNDSAPLHITSAINAPVTAIYCSTVPAFGFGPLSGKSKIVETTVQLDCRPCGLHGYQACPKGHFKCALTIDTKELLVQSSK
jgi:heptosyltransferase-2